MSSPARGICCVSPVNLDTLRLGVHRVSREESESSYFRPRKSVSALSFALVSLSLSIPPVTAQSPIANLPSKKAAEIQPVAPLSPQELYKRLSPSVYVVESLDGKGAVRATGSAVVVAPGEVVTNRHVVEEGVSWRLKRGSRTWRATVTYLDPDHDLCQLKAASIAAQPVPIRRSSSLSVGERVFAIGAPEGLELTLSEGLISGLREYQNARLIQTSAAISPGSSGGGLFDSQGRLVGVTTFFLKEGQNLNFALPGEWIQSLSKQAVSSSQRAGVNTPAFQAMILMQLGFKAFGESDYEKASDAYNEALRVEPGLADAWYWLGSIDEGKPLKQLSEGKVPNWPEAHKQAIEHYTRALELRPEFAGAWCALGNSYFAVGRKADAIHALQEAIRSNPQLGIAWLYLAMAYQDSAENQKALQAFHQATIVDPNNTFVWFGLAEFYKDQREYNQMATCLEKSLQLDPTNVGVWFELGLAYSSQGDRKMVVDVYDRMKTARPGQASDYFRKYVLP